MICVWNVCLLTQTVLMTVWTCNVCLQETQEDDVNKIHPLIYINNGLWCNSVLGSCELTSFPSLCSCGYEWPISSVTPYCHPLEFPANTHGRSIQSSRQFVLINTCSTHKSFQTFSVKTVHKGFNMEFSTYTY